jgi:uncharacterized protein (DUF427 family)
MNIESVWDYPRPPRLEPVPQRIRILHRGIPIADTTAAIRILETSHPPVYYIPPADIASGNIASAHLRPSSSRQSFCEFKGLASYWNLIVAAQTGAGATVRDAAWSYARPSVPYAQLADHLAFYASKLDECWVGDQRVTPQPGDFYGGWITPNLRGPFKGAPGTLGW